MNIIVIFLLCILSFLEAESSAGESSDESTENYGSKEVSKSGVIDNDQVFCAWEDVDARDKMATKLGTELCRFSMVSQLSMFYI